MLNQQHSTTLFSLRAPPTCHHRCTVLCILDTVAAADMIAELPTAPCHALAEEHQQNGANSQAARKKLRSAKVRRTDNAYTEYD